MKLGPIAEWGLNMNKKTIEVNPENFQTNKEDICSWRYMQLSGKLKLILLGFHEVALASVECLSGLDPMKNIDLNSLHLQKLFKIGLEKND